MEKQKNSFSSIITALIIFCGSIFFSFAWIYGSYKAIQNDRYSKFDVLINVFLPPMAIYDAYKEVKKNYFGNKFLYDNETNKNISQLIKTTNTLHKDYGKEVRVLIGWSHKLSMTQGAEYGKSVSRNQHMYDHYRNLSQDHFNDVARGALIYIKFDQLNVVLFKDLMDKITANDILSSDFKFSQEYLDAHAFLKSNDILDKESDIRSIIENLMELARNNSNNKNAVSQTLKNNQFVMQLMSGIGAKITKDQSEGIEKEFRELILQVTNQ